MSEGEDSNEYLITRHSQFVTPINIINVYGEQENRTPAVVIEDHWNQIVDEVIKIEAKGEHYILIADLNKHLPSLKEKNNGRVTAGGRLVQSFIDNSDCILVNSTEVVENGPFTREEPSDSQND